MVAEALNGTAPRLYSDAEMRDAVRAHQLAHYLDDATVASRIGISAGAFERWMNGTPSYTVARARLIRFCRGQNLIPEPSEIAEVTPEPQRSVIAYMAKQEPEPETTWDVAWKPVADQAIAEAGDILLGAVLAEAAVEVAEEPPTIEAVDDDTQPSLFTDILKHSPFPPGFALIWNAPAIAEPAIRIADGGVLLNKALRQLMGDPERVLIAMWSDPKWTTGRIAVSPHVPEQLAKMALPIPKNGELNKRFRDNLAGNQVPNGTYALLPEGDCWITCEIALNPVDPQGALA